MNLPDITASVLAEAEASTKRGSFRLEPADNARPNKRNPRQMYWSETLNILSAKREEAVSKKSGRKHTVFILQVEPTPDSGTKNVGTKFRLSHRICYDSVRAGDKENGEFIMSRNAIARLKQLLDAVGIECTNEHGDLRGDVLMEVFTENGQDSPLVNQIIEAEIKQEAPDTPDGFYNIEAVTYMEKAY